MMQDTWKIALAKALEELGVQVAGRHDDPLRWSASDLATDLAPKVANHYYATRYVFDDEKEGKK